MRGKHLCLGLAVGLVLVLTGKAEAVGNGTIVLSGVGTPAIANKVDANSSWTGVTGANTFKYDLFKGTVANKAAAVPAGGSGAGPIAATGTNETLLTGFPGGKFQTGNTVFGRLQIRDNLGVLLLEVFSADFTVP